MKETLIFGPKLRMFIINMVNNCILSVWHATDKSLVMMTLINAFMSCMEQKKWFLPSKSIIYISTPWNWAWLCDLLWAKAQWQMWIMQAVAWEVPGHACPPLLLGTHPMPGEARVSLQGTCGTGGHNHQWTASIIHQTSEGSHPRPTSPQPTLQPLQPRDLTHERQAEPSPIHQPPEFSSDKWLII